MSYLTKLVNPLHSLVAVLAVWLVAWWEGAPEMVHSLAPAALVLVLTDMMLGGVVGLKHQTFTSGRIGDTLVKLAAYAGAVAVALSLDYALSLGYWAVLSVLALVVYKEGISCLENLKTLGLPLPFLHQKFEQLKPPDPEGGI